MNLFSHMGKELRALFKYLFDPKSADRVRRQMDEILATAKQIGGPIEKEALQLQAEVTQFLKQPSNLRLTEQLKKQALRLEQETRDL